MKSGAKSNVYLYKTYYQTYQIMTKNMIYLSRPIEVLDEGLLLIVMQSFHSRYNERYLLPTNKPEKISSRKFLYLFSTSNTIRSIEI